MKQRDYSLDCQNGTIEIKLRAERRLCELTKEMEKRNGGDATKARLHLVTESHCLFRPWLEQSPGPPMAFPMHRNRNSSTAKGTLLCGTQSGIQEALEEGRIWYSHRLKDGWHIEGRLA